MKQIQPIISYTCVISKKDGKKYQMEIHDFGTRIYFINNKYLSITEFGTQYILLSEHRKNILNEYYK